VVENLAEGKDVEVEMERHNILSIMRTFTAFRLAPAQGSGPHSDAGFDFAQS